MSAFSTENRLLSIATPLGDDVLLPTGFSGHEALSRLFVYQLDLLSPREDIQPKELIGKNVTWTVRHSDAEPRFFNGFVNRFAAGGTGLNSMRAYRIEVVPWLWFLTRTSDCKVFHPNKTTPVILSEVFTQFGFASLVDDTHVKNFKYVPREYCVQYRETAFNFVSRLMEDEGIFYFWKHENGKHTLVLCRQKSNYLDCPEKEVKFSSGSLAENLTVSAWQHEFEARSGAMALSDYNFTAPPQKVLDMVATTNTVVDLPPFAPFELFDYPGDYKARGEGADRLAIRMEEEETPHAVVNGASNCGSFFPGGKFKMVEHEIAAEKDKEYVLTSVQHTAHDTTFGNTGSSGYQNSFSCIPAAVTFRPARTTPRPVVQGCQTALVVGPDKDEIHTDKFGRICVQFHWDRLGKRDENSSVFIRVGTPWAGKNWGMIHIPRIGQEVIVDFLEGDPDRPLVIGSVYNNDNMPPYDLPKNKTQSGVKSRSSLKGTPDNFNEIRFEDLKGKEAITIHAERDMNSTVEQNESHRVFGSQNISVGAENVNAGTKTETIFGDTTIKITKGNYDFDVEKGTSTTHVKGDVVENYDANQTTTVKGDQRAIVTKIHRVECQGEVAGLHVTTGNRVVNVDGGFYELNAAKKIQETVGGNSLTIDNAGNIALVATAKISLKVGDSTLTLTPSLIESLSATINSASSGNSVTVSKADVAIHGKKISSTADGDHVVKGSSVKIN